jgi:trans-aconitate 2-methyltransferase
VAGSRSRDWDAVTYDRVSTPQQRWAKVVVARLALRGDETVLDAGCGPGRVTAMLLERLPKGRVIAVDGSAAMVAEARSLLDPSRADVRQSDLLELDLGEPVDAIFSNAVFHWIHDHGRLFVTLAGALAPGGRLEAQCGGTGNVAAFHAAVDDVVATGEFPELAGFAPAYFAGPEETIERLAIAGFDQIECGLAPRPVVPSKPREFVRSVCLGAHLERLPRKRRDRLLTAVMDRLGPAPELDYVRLNISATKKGGAAPG